MADEKIPRVLQRWVPAAEPSDFFDDEQGPNRNNQVVASLNQVLAQQAALRNLPSTNSGNLTNLFTAKLPPQPGNAAPDQEKPGFQPEDPLTTAADLDMTKTSPEPVHTTVEPQVVDTGAEPQLADSNSNPAIHNAKPSALIWLLMMVVLAKR